MELLCYSREGTMEVFKQRAELKKQEAGQKKDPLAVL